MASLTTFTGLLAAIFAIAIGNNAASMVVAGVMCIPTAAMLAVIVRRGATG